MFLEWLRVLWREIGFNAIKGVGGGAFGSYATMV